MGDVLDHRVHRLTEGYRSKEGKGSVRIEEEDEAEATSSGVVLSRPNCEVGEKDRRLYPFRI